MREISRRKRLVESAVAAEAEPVRMGRSRVCGPSVRFYGFSTRLMPVYWRRHLVTGLYQAKYRRRERDPAAEKKSHFPSKWTDTQIRKVTLSTGCRFFLLLRLVNPRLWNLSTVESFHGCMRIRRIPGRMSAVSYWLPATPQPISDVEVGRRR